MTIFVAIGKIAQLCRIFIKKNKKFSSTQLQVRVNLFRVVVGLIRERSHTIWIKLKSVNSFVPKEKKKT